MAALKQDPGGFWISDDGTWRWNGQGWVPSGGRPEWPAVPLGFGDAITLPTRSEKWFETIAVEGLIGLIPFLGWFQLIGWMMTYLDRLRLGQSSLPPAGFKYAQRGWRVGVVGLIYLLVLAVVLYGGFVAIILATVGPAPRAHVSGAGSQPFPVYLFVAIFAFQGVALFVYALLHLLVVPVILRTDRFGVWAGLNPVRAAQMALADIRTSGATAFLAFISYFIASLGIYFLFVGYIFTSAYGWAMLASTVRWYEERIAPDWSEE